MKADWLQSEAMADDVRAATSRLLDAARAAPPASPSAKARVRAAVEGRAMPIGQAGLRWVSASAVVIGALAVVIAVRHRAQSPSSVAPSHVAVPVVAPSPRVPEASVEASPPPLPLPAAPAPLVPSAKHAARHRVASVAPPSLPAEDGTTLVVEAVRRLRVGHDAQGALALIDRYLDRHADGDLIEEASALGIEAAQTIDREDAARRATQYLSRFPHGRFASRARAAAGSR